MIHRRNAGSCRAARHSFAATPFLRTSGRAVLEPRLSAACRRRCARPDLPRSVCAPPLSGAQLLLSGCDGAAELVTPPFAVTQFRLGQAVNRNVGHCTCLRFCEAVPVY